MAKIRHVCPYRREMFDSTSHIRLRTDMNENQRHIFDWLNQVEPDLAELYEGSVKMIEEKTFPGRERFICHAVREIRNRLPEKVGTKGIRKRVNNTKEVDELVELCKSEGVLGVYQKDNEDREPVAEYQVSGKLLKQVNKVVHGHIEAKGIKKHNAKQLLMALETENKKWEGTLIPVVELWVDETEWFVEGAHVGKAIDDEELIRHFERFESILLSLKGYFYEGLDKIKQIVESANSSDTMPNGDEVVKVVALLGSPNYRIHFFKDIKNPLWLEPLKEQGFFRIPDDPQKGEEYDRWLEEWYLEAISEKVPEKVLGVIENVKCENPYIRSGCVKCLLKMPLEYASKGVKVVENILKQDFTKGDVDWLWIGQHCAKLMVKILDKFPDSAFKIAWALLDARVSEEKTYGKDIVAKFPERNFKELMLKYYSKVWEANPEGAIEVLVKILKRCLEDLDKEGKGEEEYDASRFFGYGLELGDLNEINMEHPSIKTVLVKGICEAGKVLIDKESGKVSELLDLLEGTNRVIFLRIAMHLLRFVKPSTEKERISRLIGNKDYCREYNPCWYEHRWLLNDKFDDVSDEAKKVFLEWLDENKYSEDYRKEITERCKKNNESEPDFEKWENRAKAEELHLVRERFKDLYEGYKKGAGIKDDSSLARRRMVSEAHFVSPEEGSSYSSEKMGKDSIENVVNYLLDKNNYEGKKNVSGWGTAKDALGASFAADVKKRPVEYLNSDLKKIENLDPAFLDRFFHAVSESVRDGSFKKEGWEGLVDLAAGIVNAKKKEKEWRECFLAILWVLHDGFGEESNRITLNEAIIRKLWLILKELVRYDYDEKSESEEDPFERQLRSVQGGAFSQVILIALKCRNNFEQVYDDSLRKELEQILTLAAKEIKRSEVNCTFGYRFAGIYWLDKEWVESNIEIIFADEMWDAVWGTYVSWGRPSPECFKFLVEKEIYGRAVEQIGKKNKYKFRKEPDKGLVEQLMIGYFNGWVDFESDVLKKFFEKASAELRSEAADFLTTGFKSVNEKPVDEKGEKAKEEVVARMKVYWKNRLEVIKGNPKENEKETIGFMGWAEESVLPAEETLELLEQTLELSGGNIGEIRDAWEFVKGVCALGKGNELLALRCLKKAAEDRNIHYSWEEIQEPIVKFLEELPKGVRSEGREVADLYGRYNPDKFRGVWEKLKD